MWTRTPRTTPTSSAARAGSAGFTLVEILIVVVIIAIVTATALLSVSVTGHDRDLEKESERMLALLQYTQEQAALLTREFGLLCEDKRFQFVVFDPRKEQWVEVQTDDVLRARELSDGLSFTLTVEAR